MLLREGSQMSSFKPGDWVRHKRLKSVHMCKAINTGEFDDKISVTNSPSFDQEFMTDYILWQPETNEWCWFYTNKLTTGRVVAQVLKQYREGDEHMIQERLIRNGNFTNTDDKYAFYELDLIEPFIGQLPSILKDNS